MCILHHLRLKLFPGITKEINTRLDSLMEEVKNKYGDSVTSFEKIVKNGSGEIIIVLYILVMHPLSAPSEDLELSFELSFSLTPSQNPEGIKLILLSTPFINHETFKNGRLMVNDVARKVGVRLIDKKYQHFLIDFSAISDIKFLDASIKSKKKDIFEQINACILKTRECSGQELNL